jgi:signal transduction histidine kinase
MYAPAWLARQPFDPSQAIRYGFLGAGALVVVSLLVAWLASRYDAKPIHGLVASVRELEDGRIDKVDVSGPVGAEVVELALAINRMRGNLTASYQEHARAALRARIRADKLERAIVELDRFAYAASHDLRAPLRGISHLSEFIREDLADVDGIPTEVAENLNLLRRRVQRLDDLLMGLLEYSRVGRQGLEAEDVDVGILLENLVARLEVPRTFTIVIADDMPTLEAPPRQLERVFEHLIVNAIKHHDKGGGKIEIAYTSTPSHARLSVTDDGPGIPAELQEKAFRIFTTLKPRDEVEGSGIGLALVTKVLEACGGKVELKSTGRGSRFTVSWPWRWHVEQPRRIAVRPEAAPSAAPTRDRKTTLAD